MNLGDGLEHDGKHRQDDQERDRAIDLALIAVFEVWVEQPLIDQCYRRR